MVLLHLFTKYRKELKLTDLQAGRQTDRLTDVGYVGKLPGISFMQIFYPQIDHSDHYKFIILGVQVESFENQSNYIHAWGLLFSEMLRGLGR